MIEEESRGKPKKWGNKESKINLTEDSEPIRRGDPGRII